MEHGLGASIGRGAAAGAIGTAALSATILTSKAAGGVPISAPHEIAYRFRQKTGVPQQPVWFLGHFAYGAACGGIYALVRPLIPAPAPIAGAAYGLAVWAVSYLGLMPRLGLYPPPHWDKPSRRRTMIVGHVLFGVVLGLLATPRHAR
jgi:uncharacterized membrane protein YagU involved in acid resistance